MKFLKQIQKHKINNRFHVIKPFKAAKIILMLLLTVIMSCSSDDDSPQITSPSVSYNTSTINATFFHDGNTNAPTVNWNGNQGTFSLANSIPGLSIDATTGVVSWTKIFAPGEHEVQVVASNSAGQTTSYFTVKNLLQGEFIGVLDESTDFIIEFFTDGIIEIKHFSPPEDAYYGTWKLIGNEIIANLTLVEIPAEQYSLRGNLVQTNTSATYSGNMYFEHDALPINIYYPFNVVLD